MSPNTFFQISHRVSHFCQWWRYIIQHLIIIKKKLKNLFFLKRDGHVGVYLFGGLWLNSWPFIQTTYSNVIISSSQKNMSFRGGGAKKKRSGFSWHADIVASPHQSEIFCSNQGDSVNFFCGATARKVNVVIGTGSTCRGGKWLFFPPSLLILWTIAQGTTNLNSLSLTHWQSLTELHLSRHAASQPHG